MTPGLRLRLGAVAVALGVALSLCNVLGLTALGRTTSLPAREWERFDPELAAATPTLDAMFAAGGGAALVELAPEARIEALFDIVVERFTHGGEMRHGPFSNWVAWMAGFVRPQAAYVREPGNVVRLGHTALCSEQSAVLAVLAERAGVASRLVWLDGHVVAEMAYDGDWHAWDTDLEVVPRDLGGNVLPVAALAADSALVRTSYGHRGEAKVAQLAGIYGHAGRHRYDADPAAAPARRFARASGWLRWALPVALVALGLFLRRGR